MNLTFQRHISEPKNAKTVPWHSDGHARAIGTHGEARALRELVRRMAAQLRSRASLRQRKGKVGTLDAKRTIRANQRYGGVPMEIRLKTRRLKPKLVLVCDVSTSVRYCSEFMLRLIYELQDQVSKARSFIFIDDVKEITEYFDETRPDVMSITP